MRDLESHIQEAYWQIDEIYREFDRATTAADYTRLDEELRRLNEQIEGDYSYMADIHNYIEQLNRDDEEHQRYLDQVAADQE